MFGRADEQRVPEAEAKEYTVYSTIDGAKACAKQLKTLFDESGFHFPLNKAQAATAKAGGFADWHGLTAALGRTEQTVHPEIFRKRLLAALPVPCRAATQAWFDDELDDRPINDRTPARYFRDAFPYVFASSVLHRSGTRILRPGSGVGQQLRADLVVGPLINMHGGKREWPLLEPDTLAVVFEGSLADIFGQSVSHPRFETEFATLRNAGLLDWNCRRLRILPPDVDTLIAHVSSSRRNKAEHWSEDQEHRFELADALRDALANMGIKQARRIADAIAQQGSDAFTTASGAVLTLLTELAAEGDLTTFAQAYRLFAQINPANADFVRNSIPAKVLSNYLTGHLRLDAGKAVKWIASRPDWQTELTASLAESGLFVSTVDDMAAQIRRAA